MEYAQRWLKENHGVDLPAAPVESPKYASVDDRMASIFGPKTTVPQETEPDMATRLNQRFAQARADAERLPAVEYTAPEVKVRKNEQAKRDSIAYEQAQIAPQIKARRGLEDALDVAGVNRYPGFEGRVTETDDMSHGIDPRAKYLMPPDVAPVRMNPMQQPYDDRGWPVVAPPTHYYDDMPIPAPRPPQNYRPGLGLHVNFNRASPVDPLIEALSRQLSTIRR